MSNADWFAKKLNPNAPREAVAPLPPLAQPQPAQYAPPSQPNYPPTQQTRPQAPRCPGCGSDNYGGPSGYKQRCYDCGYPLEQSGSGLGKGIITPGASSAGPATPALQVKSGTFNGTKPAIGADGGFIQ
jgi:hypothetical protein